MDTRLFSVAGPLIIAASWALYNIGRLAIQWLLKKKADERKKQNQSSWPDKDYNELTFIDLNEESDWDTKPPKKDNSARKNKDN